MHDAIFTSHAAALVDRTVRRFRRLLTPAALGGLHAFLDDLAFTHPTFVALVKSEAGLVRPRLAARLDAKPANDVSADDAASEEDIAKVARVAKVRRANAKRNELVCTARKAIRALAARIAARRGERPEDLEQIGMLAVLEMVDEWEAGRSSFVSYAWRRARSRMLDSVTSARARLEKPMAGEIVDTMGGRAFRRSENPAEDAFTAVATSYVLGLPDEAFAPDAEQIFAERERARLVDWALDALEPEERALLMRVYVGGEELKRVAASLGIPERSARRMRTEAIAKISKRIARLEGVQVPAASGGAKSGVSHALLARRFVVGRGGTSGQGSGG